LKQTLPLRLEFVDATLQLPTTRTESFRHAVKLADRTLGSCASFAKKETETGRGR
jgi:hypothetical protein